MESGGREMEGWTSGGASKDGGHRRSYNGQEGTTGADYSKAPTSDTWEMAREREERIMKNKTLDSVSEK